MIILGLILMAAATAAVSGVVISSTDTVPVQVFGYSAESHQVGAVFLAGAVAGLLFAVGFRLLSSGMTRAARRRGERRRAERNRAAEAQSLRQRNAELEAALAADRGDGLGGPEISTGSMPAAPSLDLTDGMGTGRHAREQAYAERGTSG